MKYRNIRQFTCPVPCSWGIVLAGAGLFATSLAAPAKADSDYVIIETGTVSGGDVTVHGINELGQAVGTVVVSPMPYAFVWLPDDAYGLSAGMNLLDSSFTDFDGSGAFDINDAGMIVGYVAADFGNGSELRPYIWDLSGTYTSHEIDDVDAEGLTAFDINNDAEPIIVGGQGGGGEATSVTEPGFMYDLDSQTFTQLAASNSVDKKAIALGVSDTISAEYFIAGLSSCEGIPCQPGPECGYQIDGQFWENTTTADDLDPINTCSGELARCVGHAVNADFWVVGFGLDPTDTTAGGAARRRATVWEDPESTPDPLPRIDSSDQATAFDIRGTSSSLPMEIVGWSNINGLAQLWRRNGSNWDRITLDDVSTCFTVNLTSLRVARAINANGWIAGDSLGVGWILVPRCPSDIAGTAGMACPDGRVDVQDLFTLLANWNTGGPGADLASST